MDSAKADVTTREMIGVGASCFALLPSQQGYQTGYQDRYPATCSQRPIGVQTP